MEFVADELVDDGGGLLLQLGIGRVDERCECAAGGGVVLESLVDVAQLVGGDLGKSGAEGFGIAVLGGGEIVKVMGDDFLLTPHAIEEFLAEDFSGGLEGQAGAAGSVGGAGIGRQAAGGCDADMAGEAMEGDLRFVSPDVDSPDGCLCSEVEGEAAAGVPVEVAVGFGLDDEVHVDAVPVSPPGGQSGASAEAKVGLASERPGEGFVDSVREFARSARKVELGHQLLPALVPARGERRALPCCFEDHDRVLGGVRVAVYAVSLGSLIEVGEPLRVVLLPDRSWGVFLLTMVPRARGIGAFLGLVAGMAVVGLVSFGAPDVSFLWHNVIGAAVVGGVGVALRGRESRSRR